MTFQTLIYGLGAIVTFIAVWTMFLYGSRLLSWIERSEIARQQAEAAEERKRRRAAAARSVAVEEPDAIPADHVAAISAAVAMAGYHVIRIADGTSGRTWASEGRRVHQTSHSPR